MTFTDRARAEAERTYRHLPFGPLRSGLEAGFMHGATWGSADALADPTDAEVEQLARSAYWSAIGRLVYATKNLEVARVSPSWEDLTDDERAEWRTPVAATITAFLTARRES